MDEQAPRKCDGIQIAAEDSFRHYVEQVVCTGTVAVATRFVRARLDGVRGGLRCCREFSVRHFVEHLVCSAFWSRLVCVRGVADGIRVSSGRDRDSSAGPGLGSWLVGLRVLGSDFFYFNCFNSKLINFN